MGSRRWLAVAGGALCVAGGAVALWAARQLARRRALLRKFHETNPDVEVIGEDNWTGIVLAFRQNFFRMYDWKLDLIRASGKKSVVAIVGWWEPMLAVFSMDSATTEHILRSNFNNYLKSRRQNRILSAVFGNAIFVANHGPHADDQGKSWHWQRKVAARMFTRKLFRGAMYDTFCLHADKVEARLAKLNPDEIIDLQPLFSRFTIDSIGQVGFGVDLQSLDTEDEHSFAIAFNEATRLMTMRFVLPLFHVFGRLYKSERELAAHRRTLHEFSAKVTRERLADPSDLSAKTDILSNFIVSLREQGHLSKEISAPVDPDIMVLLRDVVLSFIAAGRDTTACTLSFLFYLLAVHQDEQDRVAKEVREQLGDRAHPPTVDEFTHGFELLDATVNETLRLFPPVSSDGKTSAEDDVLPDGTFVPAGTRVNFEIYCIGRDRDIFGPDAEEFRPGRWLGPNKVAPTPFELPTFQPGPRQCLGKDLALFEVKLLAAQLLRRFRFELARPVCDPPYSPGITITVRNGVPVRVFPRQ